MSHLAFYVWLLTKVANTILSSEYSIVRVVSLHIWSWRTDFIQISATEINHYDSLCAISLYFSDLARALIILVVKSFKSKQYIKPQPHLNINTSWPYSDDKVAPLKWHHDMILWTANVWKYMFEQYFWSDFVVLYWLYRWLIVTDYYTTYLDKTKLWVRIITMKCKGGTI